MDTLNDLYLKYANEIGPVLEEDRYFQYLYEAIENGENVLDQQSVIMHKTVDEEWIQVIEDSIDSIFAVIQKPRRFIKTAEELVPVDLAKKITGDSVRHLSQNTQFIVNNEEGNVQPTKVLNVTVEETYDLYENRFIYHLIQRLITFIDKRTDVIFWATGDEKYNTLKFSSNFEDDTEKIEYELSMKITNKTEISDEDKSNMDVFMRIDRIRRLVMQLRRSSFCEIMAGCAKVRSPIQRTNLLTKDHDYRKCLDLWHFLERYESIGYKIDEEKRALQFDEEYVFQFYTNYIANYATFKSLLDPDTRNLEADTCKKKVKVHRKPKFLKSIKEDFVDSPNLEDVEIRKIFVEYVTLAQLEAEAKAKEAEAKMLEAQEKQTEAEKKQAEAEAHAELVQQQCEARVSLVREEAAQQVETARVDAQTRVEAAQIDAQNRIQAAEIDAQNRVQAAEIDAQTKVETAQADADARIEAARMAADSKVREALIEKDSMEAAKNSAIAEKEAALIAREESAKRATESEEHAIRAFEERDAAIKAKEMADSIRIHAENEKARAIEQAEARIRSEREVSEQLAEAARRETTRAKEESEHAAKVMQHAEELIENAKQAEEVARKATEEAEKVYRKAEKDALKKLAKLKDLTLPQYLELRKEIREKNKE